MSTCFYYVQVTGANNTIVTQHSPVTVPKIGCIRVVLARGRPDRRGLYHKRSVLSVSNLWSLSEVHWLQRLKWAASQHIAYPNETICVLWGKPLMRNCNNIRPTALIRSYVATFEIVILHWIKAESQSYTMVYHTLHLRNNEKVILLWKLINL